MSILGGNERIAAIQRALDAMTSPEQVKQFMAMHRNDAVAVSMADQKLQQMQKMSTPPPPQATVVDQKLGQGVAALDPGTAVPAQNYAGGGIIAFARGGDAGEGKAPKLAYRNYARTRAAQMGLNPDFVDTIFGIESQYNPEAQSPTGPVGIGQLTKATGKAYGVDEEERKDPYKNIDASLRFMADLQKKYKGDVKKMALAYNQGEPVADAHIREHGGNVNPQALKGEAKNYLAKLATRLAPGTTAQAETLPPPKPAPEGKDGLAALYSQYAPRRNLQTQSYGQMVPPPVTGAPLDARAPAGPVPDRNTQLNTIAAQETARRSGLASVLPPEQRAPFERGTAPVELGEGQKPVPVEAPAAVGEMEYPDVEYASGPHPRNVMPTGAAEEMPTVPVEDRTGTPVVPKSRFDADDWLMAGLKTLQAASQPGARALGAIGEGGIAGLTNKRQRMSDEAKQALEQAQIGHYKDMGEYYRGQIDVKKQLADLKANAESDVVKRIAAQRLAAEQKDPMHALNRMGLSGPALEAMWSKRYQQLVEEMGGNATMPQAGATVPGLDPRWSAAGP